MECKVLSAGKTFYDYFHTQKAKENFIKEQNLKVNTRQVKRKRERITKKVA